MMAGFYSGKNCSVTAVILIDTTSMDGQMVCYLFVSYKECFKVCYIMALLFSSVNVSPSMSARPVARWAMPAGSCTALSTASSLMVPCPLTKLSEVAMTPSTPSSQRLVLANMSPVLSLLIWSLQSLMKSGPELTGNSSTLSN